MSETIIVAIISAGAAIVVALINLLSNRRKPSASKNDGAKIVINQKAKADQATQIGIQIGAKEDSQNEKR